MARSELLRAIQGQNRFPLDSLCLDVVRRSTLYRSRSCSGSDHADNPTIPHLSTLDDKQSGWRLRKSTMIR